MTERKACSNWQRALCTRLDGFVAAAHSRVENLLNGMSAVAQPFVCLCPTVHDDDM
jgi:hypothetical protein